MSSGLTPQPSPQVLEAIGRALRLDLDTHGHLFQLAGLNPRLVPDSSRDSFHPALLQLLDTIPASAGYVLSPAFDVLATNTVAAALLSPFAGTTNMVRVLFQHPRARAVFPDWPVLAENTVHALRLNAGLYPRRSADSSRYDRPCLASGPKCRAGVEVDRSPSRPPAPMRHCR